MGPLVFIALLVCLTAPPANAQDVSASDPAPTTRSAQSLEKLERLQSIGMLIREKRTQRDELTSVLEGGAPGTMQDQRERLETVIQDLASLRSSFENALLDNIDVQLMSETESAEFNWQDELLEVVEPLLTSLKSMTKKPRQLTELRKNIALDSQRLSVADEAMQAIEEISGYSLNEGATIRLQATREKWLDTRNLLNESLSISRSQLARLEYNKNTFTDSMLLGVKAFITGRGLTLLLTFIAAAAGCIFMRFCWHLFNTRLTNRAVRRKATWYRLLSYSYHLLTFMVIVITVMIVLYVRQDVLLMGLAVLLIAAALISLRTFLPRFLIEVRLLLNLGAVREDEFVIHDGLPWQVMSLNMLTVLRNPALEGIIRLPLGVMISKVSRPIVRAETWFPTKRNDYVILPDGTFGQVLSQTPELVKLSVKGGMSMTIPTTEFYSMHVLNLSGDDTFGIAVTFGLDYSLQGVSLTSVPEMLKKGVIQHLQDAGFALGKDISNVLVEFEKSGSSSLDFLIYTTVSNHRAPNYFGIERLVQQACVAVANEHHWSIPYPQLTVHHAPAEQLNLVNLQKAA